MKYVLISLLLSANLAFTQTAENKSGDSLNNSFIARMFNDNPSIKHHHIVDVSLIDFGFSTLGYNYLYSINPNIRVGTRLGLYLKHLELHLILFSEKSGCTLSNLHRAHT